MILHYCPSFRNLVQPRALLPLLILWYSSEGQLRLLWIGSFFASWINAQFLFQFYFLICLWDMLYPTFSSSIWMRLSISDHHNWICAMNVASFLHGSSWKSRHQLYPHFSSYKLHQTQLSYYVSIASHSNPRFLEAGYHRMHLDRFLKPLIS